MACCQRLLRGLHLLCGGGEHLLNDAALLLPLQHQADGLQLLAHAVGTVPQEAQLVLQGAGCHTELRFERPQLGGQVLLQWSYHLLGGAHILVGHGPLLGHAGHHARLLNLQLHVVHLVVCLAELLLGLNPSAEVLAERLVRVDPALKLGELLLHRGTFCQCSFPCLRRIGPCGLELQVDLLARFGNLLVHLAGGGLHLIHCCVEGVTFFRRTAQHRCGGFQDRGHPSLSCCDALLERGERLIELLRVVLLSLLLCFLLLGGLRNCLKFRQLPPHLGELCGHSALVRPNLGGQLAEFCDHGHP
mmetsp:Transcript_59655/g.134142  ORF Transcript_59655/g.134142 Transcript_59655/m.134142 type:complete len:303 (+) Transcript_59655:425-1333(+)